VVENEHDKNLLLAECKEAQRLKLTVTQLRACTCLLV
jgi:hypothetical protein